jgi:ribonuclease HII
LRYALDPRKTVQHALSSAMRKQQAARVEQERLDQLYELLDGVLEGQIVAGVDEVGRGALAGPLLVAAVVLKPLPRIPGLNDSKKLLAPRRQELAQQIQDQALAIGYGRIEAVDIDRQGISASLRQAMHLALDELGLELDQVLIDGNPVGVHPREQCIVKGDSKVASIAAASIVAKVQRDAWMVELDAEYPDYGFAANKGYGVAEHLRAIAEGGLTPHHRESFCTLIGRQAEGEGAGSKLERQRRAAERRVAQRLAKEREQRQAQGQTELF